MGKEDEDEAQQICIANNNSYLIKESSAWVAVGRIDGRNLPRGAVDGYDIARRLQQEEEIVFIVEEGRGDVVA